MALPVIGAFVIEFGKDIEFQGPTSGVMNFGERFALESIVVTLINSA